ncbi:SRPBCC family protein [Hyphomicrobium sp. CS1GBMeth3]|uniref:SRPBCC family protein n=1 Tax=Hyphomicrobium sp. CS1GBMeth3 TaxID=1892845 RepID=UPI000931B2AF|nr:SRPBCC family protein [Hyphomicrobium sp. CS1GBMeth3]
MLKRILIGLAAIVLVFLGYVAFLKPAEFQIERSSIIVAPPSAVFAEVNNFHNWEAWSPWAKLDPNAKATFEGPDAGEGAVFQWSGNDQIGEGRMTLLESRPDERIRIRIDFVKPFEGTNAAEFTFKPDGPRTIVTWTMSGEQTFLQKVISVFVNVDNLVGAEFEKGLANLKSVVEAKLG